MAQARLAVSGFSLSDLSFERAFDLRYLGQQWTLQVPAPGLDMGRIRADFEARHDRQFGHHQPNGQIEIVHLRLAGIGRLAQVRPPDHARTEIEPVPYEHRSIYLDTEYRLSDRSDLRRQPIAAGTKTKGTSTY